jgi:aspartyl-tRNA(Asn)/glutamyl-tRNA(Gln) amidotransferase subunit C
VSASGSSRLAARDVIYVARLARLALTSDEVERYTVQLDGMLEHFADIDSLDLSDVVPMTQPLPLSNVMRDDIVLPCLDRAEVLATSPASEDGRFRVPPMAGESE